MASVDSAAMLAAVAHRGPDDTGEFRDEGDGASLPVWLGHRRLAIIDPSSAGRQPMRTRCGRFTLAFNGEIYNFRELAGRLSDLTPRSGTDTEVLLELLARHGEQGVPQLRGMFAFALWDRDKRSLLLGRDRQGEKPLYYYHDTSTGRLLFASEVRALLASGAVPRKLDEDGLDSYLALGSVADPYTLVYNVRAVPAGATLRFEAGRLVTRHYWRVADITVNRDMPRDTAVEGVRDRLAVAQRRCMVSDVPVGVLLSGGIDSSINVAQQVRLGTGNLRTFSVVFSGRDAAMSEDVYSRQVAERFATDHATCTVNLADAAAFLERAIGSMDQPSHDGLNTYAVSGAIRAAGLKVAVSGQGSDELFHGYPQRHRFAAVRRAGSAWPRPLAALLNTVGAADIGPGALRRARLHTALSASRPEAGAYLAAHGMYSHAALQQLRGQPRPHPERFIEVTGARHPLDQLTRLQVRHYLKDTLIRDADQMSMAHGLEMRAPFLDHDLVDFLLTVPARHKLEATRNKPLLLDAAGAALPRQVWDRPKRGFSMPVGRWILDRVTPPRTEIPGLAPEAVAAVRDRFDRDGPREPFRYLRVWTLDVLGHWLNRHRIGC